jgi:hypothetical protein
MASNDSMIMNELGRIWKKGMRCDLKYYPGICVDRQRITLDEISNIWTSRLRSKNLGLPGIAYIHHCPLFPCSVPSSQEGFSICIIVPCMNATFTLVSGKETVHIYHWNHRLYGSCFGNMVWGGGRSYKSLMMKYLGIPTWKWKANIMRDLRLSRRRKF